jgi:5-formyltetrahydrofolate cyclo-ligase
VVTARRQQRRQLRAARRALSPTERRRRQAALCAQLRQVLLWRSCTVAAYLAFDGEPDITITLRDLHRRGRALALPRVLHRRRGRMEFRHWRPGQRLTGNRYRIGEPLADAPKIDPRRLDIVLVPLVGFDRHGSRLGMGAGYFDRYFAFLRYRRRWLRPRLVGVAFDFQEVACLERAAWDVPLAAVVTERGLQRFTP